MVGFREDGEEKRPGWAEAGRPGSEAGVATGEPEPGRREVELTLERRLDGQLWAVRGEDARPVRVRRLFPWSADGRHVSLRDEDNREFALLGPGAPLDDGSRRVLDDALVSAGFVLEVTAVLDVEEEIEIRVWRVETRQGPRVFQTHLDEWPREVPGGVLVVRDVAGDLYVVPDPETLDARSRELLWAYAG